MVVVVGRLLDDHLNRRVSLWSLDTVWNRCPSVVVVVVVRAEEVVVVGTRSGGRPPTIRRCSALTISSIVVFVAGNDCVGG